MIIKQEKDDNTVELQTTPKKSSVEDLVTVNQKYNAAVYKMRSIEDELEKVNSENQRLNEELAKLNGQVKTVNLHNHKVDLNCKNLETFAKSAPRSRAND